MADVAMAALVDPQPDPAPRWSRWQRIGFRIVCAYFALYCLPFSPIWHAVCPWIAIHIFHLSGQPATYFVTGSGDTTLAYIQNLLIVLIALTTAAAWTTLDRNRPNYCAVHGWLRLLVRYTLATALLGYGFAKIFPLQFQPANLSRLNEPFGQFSPMGVLWSFMGASIPYIIFSGAAEVTGGLLLLFRRTTTLASLVCCAVLGNVVALNFCYDVPVKLYSSNLLAMAMFLAAADATRLLNVLVLNRPAPPADLSAGRPQQQWMRTAATVFWIMFVSFLLLGNIGSGVVQYRQTYIYPFRQPLAGTYEVDSFLSGSKELPVSLRDSTQWRSVEFLPEFVSVQTANDFRRSYRAVYAPSTSTITLNGRDRLSWSHPDPSHVTLEGNLDGGPVSIGLRKLDLSRFPLTSRGFHWISEFPVNR